MIAANQSLRQMAQLRVVSIARSAGALRSAALLLLFGLLATTFYLPSSASVSTFSKISGVRIGIGSVTLGPKIAPKEIENPAINGSNAAHRLLTMAPMQAGAETIVVSPPATRATGCNNPAVLCLGEVVTAEVSNAPLRPGFRERRIIWVAPDGTVPQVVDVTTDPQTDTYTLPMTGEFAQVGKWSVRTLTNRFGAIAVTTFEVGDPTQPSTDLAVTVNGPTSVTANTQVTYTVTVNNGGPDAAENVTLSNPVPFNSTFVSATIPDGFACTSPAAGEVGDIECSSASLADSDSATFTFVFSVNSDVKDGSAVYEYAKTDTSTNEPDKSDNIGDIFASSAGPGEQGECILDCPEPINAIANTEVNGQRGAHVNFDATVPSGECGTVTTSPASGSFFPVGTTVVTSNSSENGGSCSFTITVEDQGSDPPTISCPTNKETTAGSNCEAAVEVGTATATGANVTIFATRSDGKPMYTCDENGTNCTRRTSDDPFPSGTTTITWRAYAHDTPGPYADVADEESHRVGSASCTQIVVVNDVTPPTITAPANQTASADETCQFALPDYTASATVADNCACSSSDESEACDERQPITITQNPAPGTMVGLGTHTITLTANDGSSSNNGAGNTTSVEFTVTVNDTTPPTVVAPENSSAYADASCQAAVPDYAAASTAADNCDTSVSVTQSPAAGTLVGPGTHTVTVTATDDAGLTATDTVVFTVTDNTPPVISCPSNITVYLPLNSTDTSAVVNYTAPTGTDNCSGATTTQTAGLASGASFPVGTTTNTFKVTDGAGLTAECSFTVKVLYNFTGFFSPVNNPPVLNSVNAGRAIPVKFSLSGNKGLGIFALGSPESQQIACDSSLPVADLEGTETSGGSTLTYSPDQYHYSWKTNSSWAGTCRQLVVTLNDGTTHTALFKFK